MEPKNRRLCVQIYVSAWECSAATGSSTCERDKEAERIPVWLEQSYAGHFAQVTVFGVKCILRGFYRAPKTVVHFLGRETGIRT